MGFAHLAHAVCSQGRPGPHPCPTLPTPALSFLLRLVASRGEDSPVGEDFFPRDLNSQSLSSPCPSKNPPVTNLSKSQLADDKG